MRQVAAGLGLGALLVLAGCNSWSQNRTRGPALSGPALPANPTAVQVVEYLNQNARRVPGIECRDVAIDVKSPQVTAGLSGLLAAQKPRDFRLVAKVVGQNEVDIGSNHQEFWYWMRRAEPTPYVFHCNYEDLQRGNVQYMPLPFQPDWIIQALGIAEYDPTKQYHLRTTQQTLELSEFNVSSKGEQLWKVTILSRPGGRSAGMQVLGHRLVDAQGRDICTARITDVQVDSASGAVLPKNIHMVWHQERTEMKMMLGGTRVGQLGPERAGLLFSRDSLRTYPSFDLARGPDQQDRGASQIRQARGQNW